MNSAVRASDKATWPWMRHRGSKIVVFGALVLVLQQIGVPYVATLLGATRDASLLHLHMGFLLAVAMLERDRWVLAGTFALAFLGWVVRASTGGYDMQVWLPIGAISYLAGLGWTMACARWMGWPKPAGVARVDKRDLAKFAGIGLLLFPLGSTVIGVLAGLQLSEREQLVTAIQVLFARHFGVAVLTFPLVMAWSEWHEPRARRLQWQDWLWPLLLCAGAVVSIATSGRVQAAFDLVGDGRPVVLMDYRLVLFALLGWCALRLRPRTAMLLLVLVMFALVEAIAGAAERNGTPLGFFNLVHLAFELSVLLMAMLYFVVIEREGRELTLRLEAETRRDTATGLANLTALRQHFDAAAPMPAPSAMGFLLLDHTDDLVAGFGIDMQARVMNTVATGLDGIAQPFLVGMGQFALLPIEGEAGGDRWKRVIDAVQAIEVEAGGQRFGLSPYLGVARLADTTPDTVEGALLLASQLAFEARRHNEVRPLHDDEVSSSQAGALRQQLHTANDALACLRSGRMELHFQPIRPLDKAHPAHRLPDYALGEVLCRLRGMDGQLLYPDTFLGPIEAVGRSVELDLAVLESLFDLLRQYPHALPSIRRISVNLTGQSLASVSFEQQFERLLADSPLPLSALCFEITENAVITSENHTRNFLDDLRQRGCRIAIDDFGRGMQSFARLKELPVDIIKIDGAFVRNVADRGVDHALVEASVSIARAFGAETVAEFVETEATAECLRELGVQWMQGYLYAKPKPLAEMLGEG